MLDFANKNYKHVVYLNFQEDPLLASLFDESLNVDYLITAISAAKADAYFEPGETCIVFDEIQDCPGARASLKFFHLDGRFDVMATGSLLGVNGYKSSDHPLHAVPVGFEEIVDMYPMDFEEWLWTNNIQQPVFDLLRKCFEQEIPVPQSIHQRLWRLLMEYVIVGGMPAAVKSFHETHNINAVLQIQHSIIDEYKSDMVKYASQSDKSKIRECFESIPVQLSRENKKFTYSLVRKGARSSQYVSCLQWIEDAGIIRRCNNLTITELPLSGNSILDQFKIYMADTGLFVSMLDSGTQGDILKGDLYGYKGAIFENLVADILGKMGRKLYYFQKTDRLEIDFVIRYKGKCTPVECKARTGNAKSLKTVLSHPEKYHIDSALKLGNYNVGRQDMLLTLPLYMAFMLTEV